MTAVSGQILVLIGSDGKRATVSRAIATEASLVLRELLDGRPAMRHEVNVHDNLSFQSTLESVAATSPTSSLAKVTNTTLASQRLLNNDELEMTGKVFSTQRTNSENFNNNSNNISISVDERSSPTTTVETFKTNKLNSTLPPGEVLHVPDLMDFSAINASEFSTRVNEQSGTQLNITTSSLSLLPESTDHTQPPTTHISTTTEPNLLDYLISDNKNNKTSNVNKNIANNVIEKINTNNETVDMERSSDGIVMLSSNIYDAIDSALDFSSENRKTEDQLHNNNNNSNADNNNNNSNNNIFMHDVISEPASTFNSSEPFAINIGSPVKESEVSRQFQEIVELPFPYFTGDILQRVCQHMSYRFRVSSFGTENGMCQVYPVKTREIPKPMTLPLIEYLDLQDRRFIADWNETITVLMVKAATLLNYNELLQLASAKLASYLCVKSVDGIRVFLSAESDFNQAEEVELKKEHIVEITK